jgi:hypothetical protein
MKPGVHSGGAGSAARLEQFPGGGRSSPMTVKRKFSLRSNRDLVVGQFGCGTRILRVIHGRDARATLQTDPVTGIYTC